MNILFEKKKKEMACGTFDLLSAVSVRVFRSGRGV